MKLKIHPIEHINSTSIQLMQCHVFEIESLTIYSTMNHLVSSESNKYNTNCKTCSP